MSQSILQNGYAILVANTAELDTQLEAREQLLQQLTAINTAKIAVRDSEINSRLAGIEKINTYITSLPADGGADPATIAQYANISVQLQEQVARLKVQNVNATYDDLRKTHAFFINQTFKPIAPIAYGYSVTNVTPLPLFGSSARLKIPIYGDFITDQAIHLTISSLSAVNKDNRVKWYDFVGHRIIKEVRLVCDGVVLDRYGCEEMEMYYQFHVSEDQRTGWKRCVGQEVPVIGTFLQDPFNQFVRESKLINNGYQTPKRAHDELDLFIPLLFWFNTDPAFALSNWNLQYDKVWIELDLNDLDKCVTAMDYIGDGGLYVEPRVTACDLYTNHVYTIPEVAELFRHRTQFSVIRVHKRVERILDKTYDQVSIGDIKFAVESLYIRFRPVANESDINSAEIWRKNNVCTYNEVKYASIVSTAGITSIAYTPAYYYTSSPAVDSVMLSSNGSTIYDANSGTFYNSYIPLRFGGERVMTPNDDGSYLMTFGLYPGDAQPSGYLNFSQTRDQFIGYTSSYISASTPVTMSVCAMCINFLYLGEGTISLRYAN